jgi:hypothetical protein
MPNMRVVMTSPKKSTKSTPGITTMIAARMKRISGVTVMKRDYGRGVPPGNETG